jgi:hypothetical protein
VRTDTVGLIIVLTSVTVRSRVLVMVTVRAVSSEGGDRNPICSRMLPVRSCPSHLHSISINESALWAEIQQ